MTHYVEGLVTGFLIGLFTATLGWRFLRWAFDPVRFADVVGLWLRVLPKPVLNRMKETLRAYAADEEPRYVEGVFAYTAMDNTGLEIDGEIEAENEADAQAQLRSKGLFVVKISRAEQPTSPPPPPKKVRH